MIELEQPAVTANQPMPVAGAAVMARHWSAAVAHEEAILLGAEAEAVHDMRVAVRRLRAIVALFAPWYRRKEIKPLRRQLHELGNKLGAVRDLEVLLSATRSMVRERTLDEPAALLAHWEAEQASARAVLLSYLQSHKYTQFKRRLEDFIREQQDRGRFAPGREDGACGDGSDPEVHPCLVADVLPAEALRRYGGVHAYDPLLADAGLARLHRLRIAGKRLRYLLESFEDLLPKSVGEVVDLLKQVQDSLGSVHDASVAIGLLRTFEDTHPNSGGDIAGIIEGYRELLLSSRARFEELWPALTNKSLRKRLGVAVAAL